ncbi:MAG TPA: DnaJ domain-containing protein [Polyangiaceae bacterium]|nr:DnaJ domain-containing protein [Polyangiaceae bacterium]
MSRIDGATSVAEIAEQTGKSVAEVSELLERLVALGAIALDDPPEAQERSSSPPPKPRLSGAVRVGPIVETSAVSDVKHPAAALYDPAELDEVVEIDLARRRQILDLYYKLDQLSHYQVFGVESAADKKAIKAAYFAVVNVYHPDRYFGKRVGSFKQKLEKIFARLSQSYDVLSSTASRTEYDNYLRAQSKTRAFDTGQLDSAGHRAALQEVMRRIQAEASLESRSASVPPPLAAPPPPLAAPPQPEPASVTSPKVSSNPAPRPSASIKPSDPETRRHALARKLGRGPAQSGADKEALSPEEAQRRREQQAQDSTARKEWAADELKRRYQERVQAARDRQVEAYTSAAKQALSKGDSVGAANALRIAASLSPSDTGLTAQLNEVAGKATRELAASYLAQAEYEERDERWLAAAKSYAKALVGRPEARVHERVAHCLLSGDGDLREAGEMAKKAVLLEANNARFRVTLARFYVKAGMKQSAEGELSRAATLAPSDDKVSDWIQRLKRELG